MKTSVAFAPRHATVLHALLANAEKGGDAPRTSVLDVNEDATALTHDRLTASAIRASEMVRDAGVRPGDRVLQCMPTRPSFATAFLGAMLAGAVPANVAPPMGFGGAEPFRERLRRLVAYLEPAAIVTVAPMLNSLQDAGLSGVAVIDGDRLHEAAMREEPTRDTPRLPARDDLAFIQCTSGSTGEPKGVMITHANLSANCEQILRVAEIRPGEVMAHWLPLHHDMGLIGGFFAALFGGIDAVILPPALFLRRPAAWLRAVSRYRASFTAAPNFGYGFAADRVRDDQLEGVDLSSWRFLFCGAEPIHPPTLQRFLDRFAPWGLRPDCIAPSYGLAEGTLAVTIARPRARLAFDTVHREALAVDGKAVDVDAGDRMAVEVTDCGPPVEGAEVRVVDRAGTPLGPSLLGRVQFRGPATTPGYFRDPDATRAVIDTDGWFDTGDLGYLRDGRLRIAGREKDVIVIRGANYFPADFERAAATMKEVRAGGVAAIGRYDPVTSTEGLYLVVETTLTDASEGDELRLRIRGAVSAHTGIAPTAVFLVPRRSIPTTSSGKIQHEEAARLFVDPHLENGDP